MNLILPKLARRLAPAVLTAVLWLTASPLLAQESKRSAMANGDWPYLLVGLCGGILGFLALWFLVNVIRAGCGDCAVRDRSVSDG
jgi:hypothetical protein